MVNGLMSVMAVSRWATATSLPRPMPPPCTLASLAVLVIRTTLCGPSGGDMTVCPCGPIANPMFIARPNAKQCSAVTTTEGAMSVAVQKDS